MSTPRRTPKPPRPPHQTLATKPRLCALCERSLANGQWRYLFDDTRLVQRAYYKCRNRRACVRHQVAAHAAWAAALDREIEEDERVHGPANISTGAPAGWWRAAEDALAVEQEPQSAVEVEDFNLRWLRWRDAWRLERARRAEQYRRHPVREMTGDELAALVTRRKASSTVTEIAETVETESSETE